MTFNRYIFYYRYFFLHEIRVLVFFSRWPCRLPHLPQKILGKPPKKKPPKSPPITNSHVSLPNLANPGSFSVNVVWVVVIMRQHKVEHSRIGNLDSLGSRDMLFIRLLFSQGKLICYMLLFPKHLVGNY